MLRTLKKIIIAMIFISLSSCSIVSSKEKKEEIDYVQASKTNISLGLAYLKQGNMVRAKNKLDHALKLSPNLPEAHIALGTFKETVGDFKGASFEFVRAVNLSDGKGEYYTQYGNFLCRHGKFKDAQAAYQNAFKDKQYLDIARAYEDAGICSLSQSNKEMAKQYFELAISGEPFSSLAILELSKININQGNLKEASLLLAKLNSYQPRAKSLILEIKVANLLGDKSREASKEKMLHSLFALSDEYKQYLSDKSVSYDKIN